MEDFVTKCPGCNLFEEPQKSHNVPEKCWEKVAVDLFGPMPSKKHVVVVQDMGTRFPVAKLVTSTAADKVIPVLSDIYNNYGNPDVHRSDNGPPFNSKAFKEFSESRGI